MTLIDITNDKDTDLEPANATDNNIIIGCLAASALVVGIIIGAVCWALLTAH